MQDGPIVARPGFVSLIPGGKQEFVADPVADRERDRRVQLNNRRHIRRRVKTLDA